MSPEVLTAAFFVTGSTQIMKKLGVTDNHLIMLSALFFGGLATVLQLYFPHAWVQLSALILSVGTTGNIGLAFEVIDRIRGEHNVPAVATPTAQ